MFRFHGYESSPIRGMQPRRAKFSVISLLRDREQKRAIQRDIKEKIVLGNLCATTVQKLQAI